MQLLHILTCHCATIALNVAYESLRMPEIVRLSNSKVCIYPGDHGPPHFHLRGPGWSAQIEIATLEVLRGKAARSDLAEAIQWAAVPENLALLVREWKRLNERE